MIDLTDIDLMGVLGEIKTLMPKVLPVVVAFIGFRKGYGFLKSALKGA